MKANTVNMVLKYPGGKSRITGWILSHMPRHDRYLEPFLGGGSVFFNKPTADLETLNDLDGDVVNLFRVMRDSPDELSRQIAFTLWARDEFTDSYQRTGDPMEDARRFIVRCWQGKGTTTYSRTGWDCTIKEKCGGLRGWGYVAERIMKAAPRLRRAQIENRPALELIKRFNGSDTLIYADPPYPLATRTGKMYAHEMTEQDHKDLLEALVVYDGPVLLSGYDNELYNQRLSHWQKESLLTQCQTTGTRREILWLNAMAVRNMAQRLF